VKLSRRAIWRTTAALAVLPIVAACATKSSSASDSAAGSSAGSGSNSGSSSSSYGKQLSIIMITHGAASNPFWAPIENGAQQAAKDLNVKFSYEAPQDGSAVEQSQLIQAAIAKKPDAIIVTDPAPQAEDGNIQKAIKAGIPVVIFNAGLSEYTKFGAVAYVGQDESLAGQQAGTHMAQAGVKHLLCVIQQPVTTLYDRCNGAQTTMKAAGGSVKQLVVDGNNPSGAQQQIAAALSQDKSLDGVLTLGEIGFQPAAAALKTAGAAGRVKIGTFDMSTDDLAGLKNGSVLFVVDQQEYLQGYYPVLTAAQYVRYQLRPLTPLVTGPDFITKGNVADVQDLIKQGIR
jgi:simple sugar transport system substrate-binding protein